MPAYIHRSVHEHLHRLRQLAAESGVDAVALHRDAESAEGDFGAWRQLTTKLAIGTRSNGGRLFVASASVLRLSGSLPSAT